MVSPPCNINSSTQTGQSQQKSIDKGDIVAYNGDIDNKKGVNTMPEIEKKIIKNISEALPDMTEAEKMYLLGQAEGMALMKKRQTESKQQDEEKETG